MAQQSESEPLHSLSESCGFSSGSLLSVTSMVQGGKVQTRKCAKPRFIAVGYVFSAGLPLPAVMPPC